MVGTTRMSALRTEINTCRLRRGYPGVYAPDNTGRLPDEAVATMAQVAKQILR